jgi:glycosyltransferase involved in cell wall biosynthesis
MTRISIITINYQNQVGLLKTIHSVLDQSYPNIEYIVIDGASTDGSVDVMNSFSTKLAYSVSESDNGIYQAMNKGWKRATGEYCLFLNSGDYLYSNSVIEEVVKCIEKTSTDIVFGNLFAYDENTGFISVFSEPISLYYFQHNFIPHPAAFTKRSLLEKLNGFYEHYSLISDWAFFVNSFLQKATFKQIDVTVTAFYMKGSSSNGEVSVKDKTALFNNEFKFLKSDFENLERLRHFDTSIITKLARKVSAFKIKYFDKHIRR